MTIVCDKHIPFLTEAVQKEWPHVRICPMESDEITHKTVRDADVIIIRTRTQTDEQLLDGSNVRLVCTATIGFDHIDTAYCDSHHIRWMACPGCNAQAVCDYIEEALEEIKDNGQWTIDNFVPTIGIVGVGHVGTLVAQMAERNGMNVLLNDPPKGIGVSLDEIAKNCDVITFHTPLSKDGDYPTFHLCDGMFLDKCKPDALIINAARGGIVDEQALLQSGHPYVIDTWENEPDINKDLLRHALLASMHIAGYSVEGKRNATQMCLDAVAEQFGLKPIDISQYNYTSQKKSNEPWLVAVTDALKAHPNDFEALRKAYPLREESVQ